MYLENKKVLNINIKNDEMEGKTAGMEKPER